MPANNLPEDGDKYGLPEQQDPSVIAAQRIINGDQQTPGLPASPQLSDPQNPRPFVYTDPANAYAPGPARFSLFGLLRRMSMRMAVVVCLVVLVLGTGGVAAKYELTHKSVPVPQQHPLVAAKPPTSQSTASTPAKTTPTTTKPATTTAPKKTTTPSSHASVGQSSGASINSPPCDGCGPAISEEPPYVLGNADFYYGEADQIITTNVKDVGANGASVEATRADPKVNNPSDHSLVEMAVNIPGDYNLIEIGWMVDTAQFGDALPHLFLSRWIGHNNQCYVLAADPACTFVQVSKTNTPNEVVSSSGTATFKTIFSNGNWDVYYDGDEVGYFPESIWGSGHTHIQNVEIYGEVEAPAGTSTCIQMGNGKPGTESGAVKVSNFTLYGSPVHAAFGTYGEIKAKKYYVGQTSPTGFSLGGPGVC